MTKVIMFPGQGSQAIGMGKDLYDNFLEAKEVFQEVDDVLHQHLSKLIFGDDLEQLTLTHNAQPAIMTTSMAILRVLMKQSGKNISQLCDYVCGHSLGEYSAHTAAKTIELSSTARLLRYRGQAMANAAATIESGMVALIGGTIEQIEKLIAEASKIGVCEVANDNGAGQIVISGSKEAMNWVMEHASNFGVRRAIKLNVNGAFHSALMEPAAHEMEEVLKEVKFSKPLVSLITNVWAQPLTDKDKIQESLVAQITQRVRWRETMELLSSHNATHYIEIGPGKVLSTIAKRMDDQAISSSICTINDIEEFIKSF